MRPNCNLGSGSNSFEKIKVCCLNAVSNLGLKHSVENILHHKNLLVVTTFQGEGMGKEEDDKQTMVFDFHIFITCTLNFRTEYVILFLKRTRIICVLVL